MMDDRYCRKSGHVPLYTKLQREDDAELVIRQESGQYIRKHDWMLPQGTKNRDEFL